MGDIRLLVLLVQMRAPSPLLRQELKYIAGDPITNEIKTKIVCIVLGFKSRMTKFEARDELQQQIARRTGQNTGGQPMNDGSVSFGWFVRNRYLPLREANWKPDTADVKKIQIMKDLVEKFAAVPLDVIDKFMLQTHINHLATFRSKDRVLQARAYLKSIFAEAVEQDFLVKDPSRNVTPPLNLRTKDRMVLTWDQLRLVLANLFAKDRVLLTLEMTDALRPSELFALRWTSFDGGKLTITETVYKGRIRPWGKTKKSLGDVHLPKGLADDLWLWKQECPDPSPAAFIFPNSEGGFMDTGNYRRRVLAPVGGKARITEADLPSAAPRDGDAGAREGIGEGHPGSPASCEARPYGERVYAGAAGEREADGRFCVRGTDGGATGRQSCVRFATECYQSAEVGACK